MADILYYNRYAAAEEVEVVYGEGFLRWTYETALGRAGLWLVAKRAFFSRWYGWRMSRPASAALIRPFIHTYRLDESIFREPVDSYRTFNDFFYRKLKPAARPISAAAACLPSDGRHLGVPDVSAGDGLYAKGQRFEVAALLGDPALGQHFAGGVAVISRLCPVDYHRFHTPVSGRIEQQRLINGWLYSVSPIALRRAAHYLWENKRVLSVIETENLGKVAFVAIGATCVGSIAMTAQAGAEIAKGDELGYFAFGGSCVITVFERGRVALAEDLVARSRHQQEVYARFGDALATASPI